MDFCFMLLYKCFFFVRLHFKKKKKKNNQDLHGRQKFENYI